ncbi:MAG: alpha/beta hydrolase [Ahniella sp.]|nr:alpha/beta hydrolase [Ahniella sp.]
MTYANLVHPVARFLMLGAILSMIGCKTFTISERDLIQPDHRVEDAAAERQQKVERFTVPTGHGDIAVTLISRPGNSVSVMYCGGNQFRTSQMGGEVVRAFPAEADLVLFDYPGYGGSTGKPTLATMLDTSVAVYDAAKARTKLPMVVYGSSMGGFMAAHVAGARNPPRLLLEGTAPDTQQWVKSLVPWFAKPFVRAQLAESIAGVDNVEKLKPYGGPILMMVGSRDTQTRSKLMQTYATALRGQGKQVSFIEIDGRGHGQLLDVERIRTAIAGFVTTGTVP